MSANMNDKVKTNTTTVSVSGSTPQPHAPRQQTGASPGCSDTISSKVRPSTKIPRPAPEVQSHPRPIPYSHTLQQLASTAGADTGSHITDPIRAALGKHLEQAAEIRRVAGTK
jgi:hypothetical protein